MTVTDRPLAGPGLTSYRYRGRYGWVMIGARSHAEALAEARRSVDGTIDPDKLQAWAVDRYITAGFAP